MAETRVLVLGGSQAYKPSAEQAFPPAEVAAQLREILSADPAVSKPVTVQVEDYGAKQTLMSWFYWPDSQNSTLELLRGDWDYVVMLDDPYVASSHPQFLLEGVQAVSAVVRSAGGTPLLVMQWSSGSTSLSAFAEAAFRVGDGAGIGVVPAGYAWGNVPPALRDSGVRPTPRGAYVTAASIFSHMVGRSASASSYLPAGVPPADRDSLATAAWNAVQSAPTQTHYSGAYHGSVRFLSAPIRKRDIAIWGHGFSTETGMILALRDHVLPAAGLNGVTRVSSNAPTTMQDILFRRDSISYTNTRHCAYFRYQIDNGAKSMIEWLNSFSIPAAEAVTAQQSTAKPIFHLPIYIALARIRAAHAEIAVQTDGHHWSSVFNNATAAILYTLASGRCPVGDEPADKGSDAWQHWFARKTGYEVAWQYGTMRTRVPGFEVLPGTISASTTNVTTTGDETLTVRFLYPPESPVTVSVGVDKSAALMVYPNTLTFTPENHSEKQTIRLRALPGNSSSEKVVVNVTTLSDDEVFSGLRDEWDFNASRAVVSSPSLATQTVQSVVLAEDSSVSVDLGVPGATAENTTILGPFHGTWNQATSTYTPSPDFHGMDGLLFSVNTGGSVTNGEVKFQVTDSPETTLVLSSPAPLSVFEAASEIPVSVTGSWNGGRVEFYVDDTLIDVVTKAPWTTNWRALSPGSYAIRAVATDSTGAVIASQTLTVQVAHKGGVWLGQSSGSWGLSSNWLAGSLPTGNTAARFDAVDLNGVLTVTLDQTRSAGGLVFGDPNPQAPRWIMGPDALGSPVVDPSGPQMPGYVLSDGGAGAHLLSLRGDAPEIEVDLGRPPDSISPLHPNWNYQRPNLNEYAATLDTRISAFSPWSKTGEGRLVLGRAGDMSNGFSVLAGEVVAGVDGAFGSGPVWLHPGTLLRAADSPGLILNVHNAVHLVGDSPAVYRISPGEGSSLVFSGTLEASASHGDSSLAIGFSGSKDLTITGEIDLGSRKLEINNNWPHRVPLQNTVIRDARIVAGAVENIYTTMLDGGANTIAITGTTEMLVEGDVVLDCFWGTGTFGDLAFLQAGRFLPKMETMNLNGGSMSLNQLASSRTSTQATGRINFHGVTLQARESTADFIVSQGGLFYILPNGLTIDTQSHTVGVPACFHESNDRGGLRKIGSGKLILTPDAKNPSAVNKFRAPVVVIEGTLETGYAGAFTTSQLIDVRSSAKLSLLHNAIADTSGLDIKNGGTVELGAGVNDTIQRLYFNGVEQVAGTWGAPGSGASLTDARFTGAGLLTVTTSGTGNRAPVALADAYTATGGGPLNVTAPGVLANDTDADNHTRRATLQRPPLHGTLALESTGAFVYTPVAGYSGPDSFIYYTSDGRVHSDPVTVSINVQAAPNQPPSVSQAAAAMPVALNVFDETTVSVAATDPDSDPLVFSWDKLSGPGTISFDQAKAAQTRVRFNLPGTYNLRVQISDGKGGFVSSDAAVLVHDSLASWLRRYPSLQGSAALFTSDADGDGVNNLMEYALGTDPTRPAATAWPQMEVDEEAFSLIYRRDPLKNDLIYRVEASENLRDWSGAAVQDRLLGTEEGWQIREGRIPVSGEGKVFLRLVVELQ